MASTTDNNAMQAEQQTPTATTSRTTQDVKKPIQTLLYDLEILEGSRNAKDNKIGNRIVKDLKYLRRVVDLPLLRSLWDALLADQTLPASLATVTPQTESLDLPEKYVGHPYVQAYVQTLLLSHLLLQEGVKPVVLADLAGKIIEQVKGISKWYLDHFWSYIYYLFAQAQERNGALSASKSIFFELYRSSSVSRNDSSQAVLLNLILRCFMLEDDFQGASDFINHTLFPENKINNEFIKYLYYTSKVKAVELSYRESFQRVTQALRKAPEGAALGFRVQAQKMAIVVEMLMGGVPQRTLFVEGQVSKHLYAYYHLTKSLVKGEVKAFEEVLARFRSDFEKDGLLILINRLTLNVIRAGLHKINMSYSRISFSDICSKLGLPEGTDVESMVAKAIRDGVINGTVDFAAKELNILEKGDLYSTREPQINFQKRIDYCTNMINTCNKAMLYSDTKKASQAKGDDDDEEEFDLDDLYDELADGGFI